MGRPVIVDSDRLNRVLTADLFNPSPDILSDIHMLLRAVEPVSTELVQANRSHVIPGSGFVEVGIYPASVEENSYHLEAHVTRLPEKVSDSDAVFFGAISTNGDKIYLSIGVPTLQLTSESESLIPDTPENRKILDEALVNCYIEHATRAYPKTTEEEFEREMAFSRRAWELLQRVRDVK